MCSQTKAIAVSLALQLRTISQATDAAWLQPAKGGSFVLTAVLNRIHAVEL
jgi:hypothetical protein